MKTNALEIESLCVSAGDTPVLDDIDLTVGAGEVHVLLGPNGSGKSSLLAAVMGLPPFRVTSGRINYRGQRIDTLPIDERARLGLGMAFQRPPSLDGVRVRDLGTSLGSADVYDRQAGSLDLDDFGDRQINVGFSGGEIKRWEVLKLFLQAPRFLLFDEPESGVDLEHIAAVGDAINRLARSADADNPHAALIITHTGFILDYVAADAGHMMVDGRLIYSGDPRALFDHVRKDGYTAPSEPA